MSKYEIFRRSDYGLCCCLSRCVFQMARRKMIKISRSCPLRIVYECVSCLSSFSSSSSYPDFLNVYFIVKSIVRNCHVPCFLLRLFFTLIFHITDIYIVRSFLCIYSFYIIFLTFIFLLLLLLYYITFYIMLRVAFRFIECYEG